MVYGFVQSLHLHLHAMCVGAYFTEEEVTDIIDVALFDNIEQLEFESRYKSRKPKVQFGPRKTVNQISHCYIWISNQAHLLDTLAHSRSLSERYKVAVEIRMETLKSLTIFP
jgi:hypothetical protein